MQKNRETEYEQLNNHNLFYLLIYLSDRSDYNSKSTNADIHRNKIGRPFCVLCWRMDVTLVYLVFSRSSLLMSSILSLSSAFSSKLSHRRPETFIRIHSRKQTFSQSQTSDNLRKAPLVVTKHVGLYDYTTHCLPRARLSSGSAVLGRLVTIETGDSLCRSLATLAANELSLPLSLKLPTSAET